MPRRTIHEKCILCEGAARMCTYTAYYEVRGNLQRTKPPHQQLRGSLPPTESFCAKCFLKLAEERGLDKAKLRMLRQDLRK